MSPRRVDVAMLDPFVLAAALWGLSFEMVEDSVVNLVYGETFGWRTYRLALLLATASVVPVSVALLVVAPATLGPYLDLLSRVGAVVLVAVGVGWLVFARLGRETELDEAEELARGPRSRRKSLLLATQLVAIEELEILLILVPVVLASHVAEAATAAVLSLGVAVGVAYSLRHRLDRLVRGRFRLLKTLSGAGLTALGLALLVV